MAFSARCFNWGKKKSHERMIDEKLQTVNAGVLDPIAANSIDFESDVGRANEDEDDLLVTLVVPNEKRLFNGFRS